MTQVQLVTIARTTAQSHNLPPELVCAICEQESGKRNVDPPGCEDWNPWAIEYESAFFARYVAPLFTAGKINLTEAESRGFSWGLMQVMGQTAREHGYTGPMPQLCDPPTGIDVGCTIIARMLLDTKNDISAALLLWNGGDDKSYPQEVLDRTVKYR